VEEKHRYDREWGIILEKKLLLFSSFALLGVMKVNVGNII